MSFNNDNTMAGRVKLFQSEIDLKKWNSRRQGIHFQSANSGAVADIFIFTAFIKLF